MRTLVFFILISVRKASPKAFVKFLGLFFIEYDSLILFCFIVKGLNYAFFVISFLQTPASSDDATYIYRVDFLTVPTQNF